MLPISVVAAAVQPLWFVNSQSSSVFAFSLDKTWSTTLQSFQILTLFCLSAGVHLFLLSGFLSFPFLLLTCARFNTFHSSHRTQQCHHCCSWSSKPYCLQGLSVLLPEGDALRYMIERTVNWQHRAQQLLSSGNLKLVQDQAGSGLLFSRWPASAGTASAADKVSVHCLGYCGWHSSNSGWCCWSRALPLWLWQPFTLGGFWQLWPPGLCSKPSC